METAKPTVNIKYGPYDIELLIFGDQKLSLNIIDTLERVEYQEKEVILQTISANTIIKALEQAKSEIKVVFTKKNMAENDLLQMKVMVESPFLKPVQEIVLLKKTRDVSEEENVKKALDYLSKKVRDLKESKEKNNFTTYYGAVLEQKTYNTGVTYEPFVSVKLPKGKYLITCHFLLKASNSWMYIYFGQGQSVMQNAGFYVPNNTNFSPHTVRKIHTVTAQSQDVSFTTYYAQSYPITIRNAIITAKPLSE